MGGDEARQERGKQEIDKSEAKQILNNQGHDASSWGEPLIDEMESHGQTVMDTLANAYIDGYGFEISLTTSASGIATAGFTPRGLCVLNITNSTQSDQVPGPHFFLFSEFSVGVGVEIEATAEINTIGYIAHYFGENYNFSGRDREITAESFAGGTVSVNAEGGLAIGEGYDVNFSLLASQSQGIAGLTNLATGEYQPGWQGIGGGVSPSAGAGGGISVDLALSRTGPLEEAMDFLFGRPDVEKAMEESEHIEWEEPDEPVEHPELDWATGWLGTDIYEEASQ